LLLVFERGLAFMQDRTVQEVAVIKRGTVEIYREPQLAQKLAEAAKDKRQLRIKLGLDPTSPDIHLGHTVQFRKIRQFQDMGHKAVMIIGDYTARIGDPSGQDKTRPMLTGEAIDANAKTYLDQAAKVLDTGKDKLEVRHNSEWLAGLHFEDVLRLASSMTVARMLERDNFELRYKRGDPISVHEFLYPLMQGYDSVMVKADVELGGTDQTFNLLVGRDLQRLYGQPEQVVLTLPLLLGLDGKQKMSKSKGNYIGVTDAPGEMFGKLMSIPDELMANYYTLLTAVPESEIAIICDGGKTHPKEAKVRLGKTIVESYWGKDAADAAAVEFEKVFAQKQLPEDIKTVSVPGVPISTAKLLVMTGLVESGGEAKRAIQQGGAGIDGEKMNDPNDMITPRTGMVVKVGKRRFARLVVE
jgi:tyrosyl-tRNA synthetase